MIIHMICYLARLNFQVLNEELSTGAMRDVVIVCEVTIRGIYSTSRSPPFRVVSVGRPEIDLESPVPGIFVTVG